MIHIRRLFSSATLPWKFNNSKAYELPSVNEGFNLELLKDKEPFLSVYDQILNSYANQDIDWLKEAIDPKLYSKLQIGINEIKAKEQKIKVINEKEDTDLTYHNALCYLGVNIDRTHDNIPWIKPISPSTSTESRVSSLIYFGREKTNVLKVDVIFASKKKLLLLDKSENIIEGDNNENLEYHKFQFEKMVKYNNTLWGLIKVILWNTFWGEDIFKDSQWVITDIDDSLEGNPFKVSKEL